MIDAIIFDMDGVLIDSEPVYMTHVYDFLASQKLVYPTEIYRQKIGSSKSIVDDLPLYNPHYDFDGFREKMIKHGQKLSIDYNNIFRKEWLAELDFFTKKNLNMAIASSSPMQSIRDFVDTCQVGDYFSTLVSGRDLPESKPSPDIFLLAAQKLAVDPRHCLVIEDSYNGVLAGKSAGMTVIGLLDNRFQQDLSMADAQINNVEELKKYI